MQYRTPALLVIAGASTVGEDAAHHARRDGEEMGTVLPVDLRNVNQLQVNFIHQRRGLKRVVRLFPAHVVLGEPVQFLLHEWDQTIQSALIPLPPSLEKLGYFDARWYGGTTHGDDNTQLAE